MSKTNKRRKHADLIKAWADGAIIQCLDLKTKEWFDVGGNFPTWSDECEYRIKPEADEPWKPDIDEQFYEIQLDYDGSVSVQECSISGTPEDVSGINSVNKTCFPYNPKGKKQAREVAKRVDAALKGSADVSSNVGGKDAEIKALKEELETLQIRCDNLHKAKEKLIASHAAIDGVTLTDGEIALIKALRNAKIDDVYPYDAVIVYKEGDGELITDSYLVAFSIAITAGGVSALSESLSATCTALNQIQAEQEAQNETE